MKKVIALTVTLFVMIGCASFVGYKVDQEAVAKIKKGTTKFQVHNIIGIPDKAFYVGNGNVVWSYIYVPGTVKAATVTAGVGPSAEVAKTQQQFLTITFGPDDVVKDIKLSPGGKVHMPNIEENKSPK